METVTAWASTVSICALIACIAELIVSDTAVEKSVRFVLGAFMICAVIIPSGGAIPELINDITGSDFKYNGDIPQIFAMQRNDMLKEEIEGLIRKTLSENKIEAADIHVDLDIDDNDCVSITRAEIELNRKDAQIAASVSRLVEDKLGINCRTIISDD